MGLFSKRKTKQEKLEEAKKKRNIYEARKSAGEMDTSYKRSKISFARGKVETHSRSASSQRVSRGGSFVSGSGEGSASASGGGASVSARKTGSASASASIGDASRKKRSSSSRMSSRRKGGGLGRSGRLGGSSSSSRPKSSPPRKPLGF